jgi:hypothetical protein
VPSVQELTHQHKRYIDLSDRFRAAWAFHQFITSLSKILLDGSEPKYPVDFQEVYSSLKELSSQLTPTQAEAIRGRLDRIEGQLASLVKVLVAEDSKVSPSLLRQFFSRVKSTNGRVLAQLAKFYVYAFQAEGWTTDRMDKMDFILSRVAADAGGVATSDIGADRQTPGEVIQGLWGLLGLEARLEEVVAARRAIEEVRDAILAAPSLDELTQQQWVMRYRELKHKLGLLFFHPEVIEQILTTNQRLKETIRRLYQIEESRILSDFQRVLDLERQGPADYELGLEISSFKSEIDRFEHQLQREELSLVDLSSLRERTRSLLQRLDGRRSQGAERLAAAEVSAAPMEVRAESWGSGILTSYQLRLVEALDGTLPEESPFTVVLQPEIFPFRLEPREIVAYRRIGRQEGADLACETFLLEAAALRFCLNEQAGEIRSLMDETATTGQAPIFSQGLAASRLGDAFLRRFEHYQDQAVSDGDLAEAQALQWLRMRLMRDHAGHWLLVNKPLRRRSA